MHSVIAAIRRWRVRIAHVIALPAVIFARPTPSSLAAAFLIAVLGLGVRAFAAGYLEKGTRLTTAGPYAHTRNPLYFGSAILLLSGIVAMNSWVSGAIVAFYFAVVYPVVIKSEEETLRQHFGQAYDNYAQQVPAFFPQISRAPVSGVDNSFSLQRYMANGEYRAAFGSLASGAALMALSYLR
jgi:protein-S-isoprenylcysteine O-methyltransferase Ste14